MGREESYCCTDDVMMMSYYSTTATHTSPWSDGRRWGIVGREECVDVEIRTSSLQ